MRNSTPRIRATTSLPGPRPRLAAQGRASLLAALVALAGGRALAHQASVVYSEIAVEGRTVRYTFQVGDTELGPALGLGEKKPTRDETLAGRARIAAYLAAHVTVENVGFPCEAEPGHLQLLDKSDGYFAVAEVAYACKRTAADVRVRYQLFFDLDPRHQGFARIRVAGEPERQHVFTASAPGLQLARPVTLVDHVRDYFLLGVEHIFTGYDHLAFLFGLVVVAGFASLRSGLRYVLGVVTAFTVAHSLTLIAAGLDWVRLPARVVEPIIAASIFWVAVENLIVEAPRRRWLFTFGFGLVHGFGFASVLREIGLPPRGLVLSLLSFNVGVECGQLAIVSLVAPALYLFTRPRRGRKGLVLLALFAAIAFAGLSYFGLPPVQLAAVVLGVPLLLLWAVPRFGYDRAVRKAGSATLAALSLFWFLERVLDQRWLSGALG